MNSGKPSRWSDPDMTRRVVRRYSAERRFRLLGFFAVALSVGFLAFLLITMAWKGLGGFTAYEARLPIDFSRSDLFLDPSILNGPDAHHEVASADLSGVLSKAAVAAYGPGADEMFGDGAVEALTDAILADPAMLTRTETLWLPLGSGVDAAAKSGGDADSERLVAELERRDAL
ncbi:MAG: DUF3333 domain-containing protein, partial [Sphingomicrobium sp.]